MININILFPKEKKRIKEEIAKEIKKQYQKEVKVYKFQHIGDEKVYLYICLEDNTWLYITASIDDIASSMTICDDLEF